jgi:broad specificity phosphatase PhoE
MDTVTVIATVVSTIGTTVIIVAPLWNKLKKFTSSWEVFMRDWSGEDERPGHDKEPGVMERLNNLDGEFKNNGGSSLKDAVDRIEKKLGNIEDRLEEGNERFDNLEKRVGINNDVR